MPDVHAVLSASAAKRWLNCPPSVRLCEGFDDDESVYAAEGTLAHALAEITINHRLDKITRAAFKTEEKRIKLDPMYNQEMADYIEGYVDQVMEIIADARKECKDATILTEQMLDYSKYATGGFGTGDVVVITDDAIHVIDLKYGKGVPVSAIDNPQLRLYGLGAIEAFAIIYDFTKVRMTIIQPRLDSMSTDEMTVEDLEKWGREYVAPRAQLAWDGVGDFAVGDHCRFCKARRLCRARAEKNLELAKLDFKAPALLTDEEIGEILKQAEQIAAWATEVKEYAQAEAINGKHYAGWKLVEGRSTRKYTDDAAIITTLQKAGYDDAIIFEKKLYGITAMEKNLGKKIFTELLGEFITKPAGKPTLVEESDKRPAINGTESAKADFQ